MRKILVCAVAWFMLLNGVLCPFTKEQIQSIVKHTGLDKDEFPTLMLGQEMSFAQSTNEGSEEGRAEFVRDGNQYTATTWQISDIQRDNDHHFHFECTSRDDVAKIYAYRGDTFYIDVSCPPKGSESVEIVGTSAGASSSEIVGTSAAASSSEIVGTSAVASSSMPPLVDVSQCCIIFWKPIGNEPHVAAIFGTNGDAVHEALAHRLAALNM